jgi:hypothetical protein
LHVNLIVKINNIENNIENSWWPLNPLLYVFGVQADFQLQASFQASVSPHSAEESSTALFQMG